MSVRILCYANLDDAEPSKVLTGDEHYVETISAKEHRIVLNPNHKDPKQSAQVFVKASDTPGHYARVEVLKTDFVPGQQAEEKRVGFYACDGSSAPTVPLVESPTFEEYVDAGYRPSSYPPRGYNVVQSEGYTHYLEHKNEVDAEWDLKHNGQTTAPIDPPPAGEDTQEKTGE